MCRLNLAEGRFLSPLPAKSPGINACGISSVHGLFGCAGDDGVLECFDLRKRTSIGTLHAAAAAGAVSFCAALFSMRWLVSWAWFFWVTVLTEIWCAVTSGQAHPVAR